MCKFLNNTKDIYFDLFEGILSTFQVKMFKSAITGPDWHFPRGILTSAIKG